MARFKIKNGEAVHWVKLTVADEPVGSEGAALGYMVYGAHLRRQCSKRFVSRLPRSTRSSM